MNKFIILIPEEYDQYEVERAFPFITACSKEQIEEWMQKIAEVALDYENKAKTNPYYNEPDISIGTYKIRYWQLIENSSVKPPRVLELNDWLLVNNINSNREKPIL